MKKKRNPRPDRTTAKERRVAVIWTRVSTKEQAEHNLSLETQEKACQDYAKRLGIEVVRIELTPAGERPRRPSAIQA